mmetsp:Transcript_12785/g.36773  ORF Transcript_12785/g.36773 Transcript_12785/m.36773 type:complete len:232 (+) Transcript_12785:1033-1728(+)
MGIFFDNLAGFDHLFQFLGVTFLGASNSMDIGTICNQLLCALDMSTCGSKHDSRASRVREKVDVGFQVVSGKFSFELFDDQACGLGASGRGNSHEWRYSIAVAGSEIGTQLNQNLDSSFHSPGCGLQQSCTAIGVLCLQVGLSLFHQSSNRIDVVSGGSIHEGRYLTITEKGIGIATRLKQKSHSICFSVSRCYHDWAQTSGGHLIYILWIICFLHQELHNFYVSVFRGIH